ncbi:uncharacterized protein VNE69_12153 [Vairimorpha necatrix]|uniref:Uncharacterized protein n=1 Tax=Vairimorpha necatrix TaxID=6039 RepID=A0AAX4JHT8_9MICR
MLIVDRDDCRDEGKVSEQDELNLDISEIQGTKKEIALHKLQSAFELHHDRRNLIDDTSIEIGGKDNIRKQQWRSRVLCFGRIFCPDAYTKPFDDMNTELKNKISHR